MSAKEMADYLAAVTPDNDQTLTLAARGALVETVSQNVRINIGDDGSEETIILSSTPVFFLEYPWNAMDASDAGIVYDFFTSSAKGGGARSFRLAHTDGHTYVVRFDCDLKREIKLGGIHSAKVVFKVLGTA